MNRRRHLAHFVQRNPSRFDQLVQKLAHRKGVTNPKALAAYIGRKKFGAGEFAAMANTHKK